MIRPRLATNVLVACWLILALAAATAHAQQGHGLSPVATPAASTAGEGWRIVDIEVLDDRTTPVALSPDGQLIAGLDEEDRFCVWDVATLEPACDLEEREIQLESIAWAPDSTAVAYSLSAFILFQDSDIFVFDLETGTSVNLTDDGFEGMLDPLSDDVVSIDVVPAWSADSQSLTFARGEWGAPERGTSLMTIARTGGDPEPRHTFAEGEGLSIYTPMFSLSDGALLYAVGTGDRDYPETGIWHLDADGEARMILSGADTEAFPTPAITDVVESESGTRISGQSVRPGSQSSLFDPISFVLDLESRLVTPLVHPEDELIVMLPAGLSPDGSSMLSVNPYVFGHAVVMLGPDVSVTPLPEPEDFTSGSFNLRRAPDWAANNTVLVSGFSPGAYLLTVEPVS